MIAVVTGAGRGIGRAIALELADRGCDIAVIGRAQVKRNEVERDGDAASSPRHAHIEKKKDAQDKLAATCEEVVRRGRKAIAIPCDVAKSSEVDQAVHKVLVDLGVPGIVVTNAGVAHRTSVLDTTEEQWDEVIDVNLKGTFLFTKAFLRPMLAEKRGRFIAIGSISGTMGTPRLSAYCASKWGTVGFVKSLAEELRGTGLQTMCVMPGSVDTDMLRGSGFAPAMQPEDVAKIVAYAAIDAPAAMNGSIIEAFGP